MKRKIRVFVCYWHDSCRHSLLNIFHKYEKAIEVVGSCPEYPDCVEWLENNQADQVVIGFPSYVKDTDGTLNLLRSYFPEVTFVEFSAFEVDFLEKFHNSIKRKESVVNTNYDFSLN
ncbi:MAG: hypothetical protein R2780_01685 [Crocinitomicaceae bacterium]